MEKSNNIIGVFDSGLGGLTVFRHFLDKLPGYSYIYLGDNARLPYGNKSPEMIYEYALEAVNFLFSQGCKLIIIACNTASAQALRRLQQEYLPANYPDRRILGVIRPLAEAIGQNKHYRKIGVLGTRATVNSCSYDTELKNINPNLEVIQQSAPLLVPLIEEDWLGKPETKMILKKYLRPLKTKQIDTLILACTHYPFLYAEIKKIMGHKIIIPQPGEIIAASLKDYISRHPELGLEPVPAPERHYYTTDNPDLFKKLAEKFLGEKIALLEKADISGS